MARKIIRLLPQKSRSYIRRVLEKAGVLSMGISRFESHDSSKVSKIIQEQYRYKGELLDIFSSHQGNIVHKWHHYIPLYDRYLCDRRGDVRFLEIGVSEGGSLEVWRRYLGDSAIIVGVDVDPSCRKYDGYAGRVRIGSQADAIFLQSVVEEMGGLDVVLDDGSHLMQDIKKSLSVLFPLMNNGGLYIIEDLHTSYWREYGGGGRNSFFRELMGIIDDMHRWYHSKDVKTAGIGDSCVAVHVHDSFVVLEKGVQFRPEHSRIGGSCFEE
ncbi:class I SAM-dependent methyltransferase [Thioalkalivibrio sp. ALJ2]|uniref:class I SAM-dependent methyltransferase n=1 Tax=Thioalkalivibrio sp. ALJ2 TaxID=1261622 RepID=UPI0018CA3FA6|nr:class I SAM-dependent methyltransferase [Thioalkalivibrio sp. ALJ2]